MGFKTKGGWGLGSWGGGEGTACGDNEINHWPTGRLAVVIGTVLSYSSRSTDSTPDTEEETCSNTCLAVARAKEEREI